MPPSRVFATLRILSVCILLDLLDAAEHHRLFTLPIQYCCAYAVDHCHYYIRHDHHHAPT